MSENENVEANIATDGGEISQEKADAVEAVEAEGEAVVEETTEASE